jgi:hypothetical protein
MSNSHYRLVLTYSWRNKQLARVATLKIKTRLIFTGIWQGLDGGNGGFRGDFSGTKYERFSVFLMAALPAKK